MCLVWSRKKLYNYHPGYVVFQPTVPFWPISHVQAAITKRCFKTSLLELVGTASYCLLEVVESPSPIWLRKSFPENSKLKQACFHEKCLFWRPHILQRKRFTKKVPCFALSHVLVDYKWAQWTVPWHLPFVVLGGGEWDEVQGPNTNSCEWRTPLYRWFPSSSEQLLSWPFVPLRW